MQAIVLCGGKGQRMGSLTQNCPKSLVKLRGKPLLWYILKGLEKAAFTKVILPVGYLGEQIKSYCNAEKKNFSLELHCKDTGLESNIGDRISQVKHMLEGSHFLLINGDCIADVDYANLKSNHVRENVDVTSVCCSVYSKFGLFEVSDENVKSFARDVKINELGLNYQNTLKTYTIYSGISMIKTNSLKYVDLKNVPNFEENFFNLMIEKKKIRTFLHSRFWTALETARDINFLNEKHNDIPENRQFSKYIEKLNKL